MEDPFIRLRVNSIWVMDVNCNVTLSYSHKLLYRNNDLMSIQVLGYGESLVKNLGACTIANDTGNKQRPQIAACRVTGTWGFLILGRETAQNVGYIHFLEVTPPTLTSMSQINTNVNALRPNSGAVQVPACEVMDDAVILNGKRHSLPATKENGI